MTPRLIHMEPGGWLALTDPAAPVQVGVFGATKDEAADRLRMALLAREELHAAAQA